MAARFFRRSEPFSRSFRSMGGLATVTICGVNPKRAETVTEQVESIFDDLELELSTYRSESTISQLADNAGGNPAEVPEAAWRVLNLAQHFGQLSEGAFDVTVAPVVKLWGFGSNAPPPGLPSAEGIQERMKLVGFRHMILKDRTVFLPVKGMAVDLGGIAKGYAVDRAFEFCRSVGVNDFLIDLSGNIRVSGRPQWGDDWQIGVRDPFDRSRIIGKIILKGGLALATSGSYERFVEVASVRYSHIIDPRNGCPVSGTAGVTALCGDATSADCLSTWFFVLGLKGAAEILQKTQPVDVLIIPDKYPIEIWLTPRFAEAFIPMPELSDTVRILRYTST